MKKQQDNCKLRTVEFAPDPKVYTTHYISQVETGKISFIQSSPHNM